MAKLRILLALQLAALVVYTLIVIANHGITPLLPTFFGDMAQMTWPGQFNADFFGFLMLSALWTAWRHEFSAGGIGLGVVALIGGIPFLTTYLLYHSFQVNDDMRALLLGPSRV